uniref:Uncharacterized protein TCIL3000_9_6280 n=1 Tax=Trypanosoma congolense (strain IL3000) TaxID=1068625 RepID=G0UV02_TRYCI|nr:unnamed protein product [Trypanosoma congolense IL3000]
MSRLAAPLEKLRARIEQRAHRRAMKDQKKYGKEVQAEVLRQRAKYKREMGARINEWRRKRKGNDELGDILEVNNVDDGTKSRGRLSTRTQQGPRQRNLRPGGGKRRPGKNARRRQ